MCLPQLSGVTLLATLNTELHVDLVSRAHVVKHCLLRPVLDVLRKHLLSLQQLRGGIKNKKYLLVENFY